MIFIPVAKLENNTDKSFFVEQVQLYTKLVNSFCLKNHIENNYDEVCNLQQLRDTLLPKLMSGEIRVTNLQS